MTLHRDAMRELARLEADDRTNELVQAALLGEDEVEQVIEGEPLDIPDTGEPAAGGEDGEVPSVYLQAITVSGFRGIGPESTLEIPPGPGLTVVVGRNGSGKSSFAEGLEVLLTGNSLRWADKAGPWKQGWKNLHDSPAPRITARFQVEGKRGLTTADRAWSEGDDFAAASTAVQHHGEKRTDLAGVGWIEPLDLYRPLLSYNELGRIDTIRPSVLFDTLAAVLGVDLLNEATKALADARLLRQRRYKEINRECLDHLIPTLENLEDDRAEAAVTALRKRGWDLDALARLGSATGTKQNVLSKLAALEAPDEEQVLNAARDLEAAHTEASSLAGTEAENARRLVRLLRTALEHHQQHGDGSCPVCGAGTLDAAWRESTGEQIGRLRKLADECRQVERNLQNAMEVVQKLATAPSLPTSPDVDITVLRAVWARWGSLPDDPGEIPGHLITVYQELRVETANVSEQAAAQHSEREERWTEVLPDLLAWVSKARRAVKMRAVIKEIKQAEDAMKKITEAVRSARWAPIQERALGIWGRLSLRSNVDLRAVELTGVRNRRRVDLPVEVDGAKAPALAVASQGEVSCLALSLFFPRATLPDSPFRFLVIDDPVQAMDPARVDGLARVLSDIAADRQLVVFTHDDRLPESLRRLRIDFTCKQVTRRPGSVVEVRDVENPVIQCFMDARAVAKDSELPEGIARRVVPGFCREGLEAACAEAVRRRRLGRGEPHAEVERELGEAKRLTQKAALAFFDDAGRGGDVLNRINRWSRTFGDAFQDANRGAHGSYPGSLMDLVNDCHSLAERIRRS